MWKVFTPRANNVGTQLNDDNLNTFVGAPGTICTESYIVIGAELGLDEISTNNLSKYLTARFARNFHSLAKASQDATAKTYRFTPLQDFTDDSDIDWSVLVQEVDKQLYKKYGLTEDEINHILFYSSHFLPFLYFIAFGKPCLQYYTNTIPGGHREENESINFTASRVISIV